MRESLTVHNDADAPKGSASFRRPPLRRACSCHDRVTPGEECRAQHRANGVARVDAGEQTAPYIVNEVARAPGVPLSHGLRAPMEQALGHDFSHVRVHTDSRAAESADAVQAEAYTVGQHIAFAPGRYQPTTADGLSLLTHELVHVVQQGNLGPPGPCEPLAMDGTRDQAEIEAQSLANSLAQAPVRRVDPAVREAGGVRRLRRTTRGGIAGALTGAALGAIAGGLLGLIGGPIGAGIGMAVGGALGALIGGILGATLSGFSESSAERFAGYDDSESPHWLVVPVGGARRAAYGEFPDSDLTFESQDTSIATVATAEDGIQVQAVAHGETEVQAKKDDEIRDRLQVAVKNRRDETVDYHFMSDSATPQPHATTRSPGEAATFTATLNQVWARQANVHFTQGTVDSPQVPTDLGPEVSSSPWPSAEWNAVTALGTGASLNVFLVWEYVGGDGPANAAHSAGNVLLEDDACDDGLTVAHEAGHFLGVGHPTKRIMSGCGGSDRERVTKAQADIANP